jgi:hypothetical protein
MTPWAKNILSNSFIKLFATLVKPHTHHAITYPWKQQIIFYKKNIEQNGKVLLPLHWFFTNDLTTTKTSFVTCDRKLVSKFQCTAHICWPFVSKVKCQILEFKSSTHCIWMFSCLNSNNDLKAQKLDVGNLEVWSKYIL